MASLLGKMPTTSVRRLTSRFNRPDWVRRVQLGPGLGKGHVGEHLLLGAVHDCCKLRYFRPDLVVRRANDSLDPSRFRLTIALLSACRFWRVLGKRRGNEGGHDAPSALSGWAKALRMKWTLQRWRVAGSTFDTAPLMPSCASETTSSTRVGPAWSACAGNPSGSPQPRTCRYPSQELHLGRRCWRPPQ
jgi:hypothetical protein